MGTRWSGQGGGAGPGVPGLLPQQLSWGLSRPGTGDVAVGSVPALGPFAAKCVRKGRQEAPNVGAGEGLPGAGGVVPAE